MGVVIHKIESEIGVVIGDDFWHHICGPLRYLQRERGGGGGGGDGERPWRRGAEGADLHGARGNICFSSNQVHCVVHMALAESVEG